MSDGLANVDVRSLLVEGLDLFAGTNGGGIFLSTDNGSSWAEANTGLSNKTVNALAATGSNLFAGTNGGVFLSTDNGSSWTAVNTGLTSTHVYALCVSGADLFAGTNGGVFLSTDNGSSWNAVNNGLTTTNIGAVAASGTSVFAGTSSGIFRTTDNGLNWTASNTGLTNTSVNTFEVIGGYVFVGTSNGGVFRSSDDGATWAADSVGLPALNVAVLLAQGSNLYAGLSSGVWSMSLHSILPPLAPTGLFVTDSSSATITIKWQKNNDPDFLRYRIYQGTTPDPTTKVDSTTGGAVDTSKIFAGLTNGTRYYFRVTAVDSAENESDYSNEVNAAPQEPSGVEELVGEMPRDFSLTQNYPNPFNPSTTIRYALPERSRVRLEIYNLLGERVKQLVDGELDAGYHSVVWDAAAATGMYYYRIEAVSVSEPTRRFVNVKKMILVR